MQDQPVLLSAEAKLGLQAQMLDALEQAMMAVDLTGRVVFWNRFAEKLTGWTAAEAQGRSIDEVLAPLSVMETARANLAQLREGEGWAGTFLLARRGGVTFMAHLSLAFMQIGGRR
jgi:PAS domain S-box-containing protein